MWMTGAACAAISQTLPAQAGHITINLTGNYLSATGGNHLISHVTFGNYASPGYAIQYAALNLNSRTILGVAFASSGKFIHGAAIASLASSIHISDVPTPPVHASIPITFTGDPRINNGLATPGFVDVTVTDGWGDVKINIDSYSYDSVPDQTSTLGLLALGAGGLLALRRSRLAA